MNSVYIKNWNMPECCSSKHAFNKGGSQSYRFDRSSQPTEEGRHTQSHFPGRYMFRLAHTGWRHIHPCLQHQHKIMLCSADIKNTQLKLCFKNILWDHLDILWDIHHILIIWCFQFYAYKHSNRAILNPARVCGLFNAHYTHTFYRKDRSCCVNLFLLKKFPTASWKL